MDIPSLAWRLRTLREYTGLSARTLGEIAGLKGASHFGLIESGDRSHPSAETLVYIARALGTTVEWLVTGDGNPPSRATVCVAVEAAQKRAEAANDSPAPARKPRRAHVA